MEIQTLYTPKLRSRIIRINHVFKINVWKYGVCQIFQFIVGSYDGS